MVSIQVLKKYDFFKVFNDEELEKLAAVLENKTFKAGTQIYKEGDPASHLYVMQEGKAILTLNGYMGSHKPPLQVTVDIITAGDSMGWSAVVEPYIYTLGSLCVDLSTFIAIDSLKLRGLIGTDYALGFKIMKQVSKIIAVRLTHTRIVLIGERGLAYLTEY